MLTTVAVDDGLQMVGCHRAHVALHQFSLRTDYRRGRQSLQGFERYQWDAIDLEVGKIDVEWFQEGPGIVARDFFEIDPDNLNLGVIRLILHKFREFAHTRAAPRGPEVDHHPATPEFRQTHRFAIQILEREINRIRLRLRAMAADGKLLYPVRDGIPVLLVDEGIAL